MEEDQFLLLKHEVSVPGDKLIGEKPDQIFLAGMEIPAMFYEEDLRGSDWNGEEYLLLGLLCSGYLWSAV